MQLDGTPRGEHARSSTHAVCCAPCRCVCLSAALATPQTCPNCPTCSMVAMTSSRCLGWSSAVAARLISGMVKGWIRLTCMGLRGRQYDEYQLARCARCRWGGVCAAAGLSAQTSCPACWPSSKQPESATLPCTSGIPAQNGQLPRQAAQHAPATPTPPRWRTLAPGWARRMHSAPACAAHDGPAGFGSRPAGQPSNGTGVSTAVGRNHHLPDLLGANPSTSQQIQPYCNQPTSSYASFTCTVL